MAFMSKEGEEREKFLRVVSATRLHLPIDAVEIPEATEEHLRNYVRSAQDLGVVAAIAVNAHEAAIRRIAEETAPGFQVHILPVPCWGAFVPALNALLNFAQRCGARYIMYQSLEVRCTVAVLQRLLDHHTDETLVVGPVFDGHDFRAGERLLDGRTTPWNTLALWSVRKLALTGFLCIADGLPDVPPSVGREGMAGIGCENPQEETETDDVAALDSLGPMGSDDWWTRQFSAKAASATAVPAGVEEVTAIALLQHLHGQERARAALLQLPRDLREQLSWSASWGKDERRAKWHKYKMESKVARPAAQLQELFKFHKSSSDPQLSALSSMSCIRRRAVSGDNLDIQAGQTQEETATDKFTAPLSAMGGIGPQGEKTFGIVMHYGESIPPPPRVKWIAFFAYWLFSVNSTAVLTSAFRHINAAPAVAGDASKFAFVTCLIGGVYLPMPLSLSLTRRITRRANHWAGLVLFGSVLAVSHLVIVCEQCFQLGEGWQLLARFSQGLGSGVLFQMRFVLASLSTSDLHATLQSWTFLVSDLGMGLGTLLPAATASLPGSNQLRMEMPELLPSLFIAVTSLGYVIWVLTAFPKRLPFLNDCIRFPSGQRSFSTESSRAATKEAVDRERRDRFTAWTSGTLRVFVQSAILPTLALSMRDAKWTGNFRQTFATAAILLLPMPFEAMASRLCCSCAARARAQEDNGAYLSKMVSGAVGALALAVTSAAPRSMLGDDGDLSHLFQRLCELAILMIVLSMAAPFNATRLYQLKDAERAIVILEWQKAYIGRLFGPLFAILLYHHVGYQAVLATLCTATLAVTLTA